MSILSIYVTTRGKNTMEQHIKVYTCFELSISNVNSAIYLRGFPFLPLSPSGYKGIMNTVRAGGRLPDLQKPYLCFMDLSRPVIVQRVNCPFTPYGPTREPKTCQIRQQESKINHHVCTLGGMGNSKASVAIWRSLDGYKL